MKYDTIMLIPDTQFEPGKSIRHMRWAGQAAKEWGVNCAIHIGDYNDREKRNRRIHGENDLP